MGKSSRGFGTAFVWCGLCVALLGTASANAATPAPAPDTGGAWRAMLEKDLAGAETTLNAEYIYAVDPGGAGWRETLDGALAAARADEAKVTNQEGYQAVMRRFAGAFQDPHLRVRFQFQPASLKWPRFLVRYVGGRYRVAASEATTVAAGEEVSACDGAPIDAAIETTIAQEGYIRGIDASKAQAAESLFVDAGSPLRTAPKSCTIGGRETPLDWTSIDPAQLTLKGAAYAQIRNNEVSAAPFGDDGVWVRLGTFAPDKPAAEAYHALIKQMPGYRDKSVIVFDVRGNPGGSYDWFMAVLKALYGPEHVAYYARARTEITAAFVHPLNYGAAASAKAPVDPLDTPVDSELQTAYAAGPKEVVTASGAKVYALTPTLKPRPATAPVSLSHAKVYVLADYGCASACIAFLDEALRIPGVVELGTDTYVDRRSGSPGSFPLASGMGALTVPAMVRDGRERGENVPRKPQIAYDGDMSDTAAVKAWVSNIVREQRHPDGGAQSRQ